MRYDYDMLGNRIHQASMEAGERWMLNDVAGKPLYAWDSRDHRLPHDLRRARQPVEVYSADGDCSGAAGRPHRLRREPSRMRKANNLRGKPFQIFDGAGVVTTADYDFKGNPLSSTRQLCRRLQDHGRTGRPRWRWKRTSSPAAPATMRSTAR